MGRINGTREQEAGSAWAPSLSRALLHRLDTVLSADVLDAVHTIVYRRCVNYPVVEGGRVTLPSPFFSKAVSLVWGEWHP